MHVNKCVTWRPGFQHRNKIDATAALEAIDALPERTPAALVEAARDKAHVCHPGFEWNKTEAAKQYNLYQARTMIGALEVEIIPAPEAKPVRTRALEIEVSGRKGSGETRYGRVEELMQEPTHRDRLLLAALRALQTFRRKFAALSELKLVFEAIDAEVERIEQAIAQ